MIQVIERFHTILEHVSEDPETPKSLTELAKLIGVSLPACSNIVRTMVSLGYLESTGKRQGYTLGATPSFIARKGQYKQYLVNIARPILEKLIKEIEELVVLVVEQDGKRVELLKLECDTMVRIKSMDTVRRISLFETATGCLLSSYMSEEKFNRLWANRNPKEGNLFETEEPGTIKKIRDRVAAAGEFIIEPKATTEEQSLHESATLAIPVFEHGKVIAAVGSRVPAYRFKNSRRQMVIDRLRESAREISCDLSRLANNQ